MELHGNYRIVHADGHVGKAYMVTDDLTNDLRVSRVTATAAGSALAVIGRAANHAEADALIATDAAHRNMWGTLRTDVGEDFCSECERDLPSHYGSCPLSTR